MLRSMTGYGKAEATINHCKYTVEIRSLNGKSADISLKTSLIPRDKELLVRQFLTAQLNRGTIDLYINAEKMPGSEGTSQINKDVLTGYLEQMDQALRGSKWHKGATGEFSAPVVASVMRFPDVLQTQREELSEEDWENLFNTIKVAAMRLDEFRETEGVSLRNDILSKVALIESFIPQVEAFESERIDTVRARLDARLAELSAPVDAGRLEQEIIFYIDKFDINEEKVRLRQHCNYFRETMDKDEYPGKKLGFIAQEMGREINTLGSKANHAEIQKIVVKMKAELEKIKEQSMNVL